MDSTKFKEFYNKKEVLELLSKTKVTERKDLELSDSDPGKYYELPDGRLLLVLGYDNNTGTMYRSIQEFREIMGIANSNKNKEPVHMMSDLILDSNQFLIDIPLLIKDLSFRLDFSIDSLDRSLESLRLIDSKYRKNKISQKDFFKTYFLLLIAYTGEVYINSTKGEWLFKKVANKSFFEAYVKIPDGRIINIYKDLFEDFYEDYNSASIYKIVTDNLSFKRF